MLFNYAIYIDEKAAPIAAFDSFDDALFFAYEASEYREYDRVIIVSKHGAPIWDNKNGDLGD